jgi:hypothetical protein
MRGENPDGFLHCGFCTAALQRPADDPNLEARMWSRLAECQRAAGDEDAAAGSIARALALYEQKSNVAAGSRLRQMT